MQNTIHGYLWPLILSPTSTKYIHSWSHTEYNSNHSCAQFQSKIGENYLRGEEASNLFPFSPYNFPNITTDGKVSQITPHSSPNNETFYKINSFSPLIIFILQCFSVKKPYLSALSARAFLGRYVPRTNILRYALVVFLCYPRSVWIVFQLVPMFSCVTSVLGLARAHSLFWVGMPFTQCFAS